MGQRIHDHLVSRTTEDEERDDVAHRSRRKKHGRLLPAKLRDPLFERIGRHFGLEQALLVALAMVLSGLALGGVVVANWISQGFGTLGEEQLAIVAMTLVVAGIQIFFTSFLTSLLGLRRQS